MKKTNTPHISQKESQRQMDAARKKMQDQQQAFQKIARDKEARLRELFSERMEGEIFPAEQYSQEWKQWAFDAFIHTQPMSHQVTLEDFAKVVECGSTGAKDLNLFNIGVLCNSADYLRFLKETVAISNIYKARVKEIRNDIEMTVEQEVKAEVEAIGSHGGLKSVMGQA